MFFFSAGIDGLTKTQEAILAHALQMSWQVKSKHGVVSGLLAHLPVGDFLRREPQLGRHLLTCMRTNYMAPPATQVFSAILKHADWSNSETEQEVMTWMSDGLLHDDSLLKLNVNNLWLPPCVKFAPKLFQTLLKDTEASLSEGNLGNPDAMLYKMTCLQKVARAHHVSAAPCSDWLHLVLRHADEKLRLDGLALVCVSPRRSEPITAQETELLRDGLRCSMNSDSAPFRQQLQGHVHALVVRGRDSALAALKGISSSLCLRCTERGCWVVGAVTDPWGATLFPLSPDKMCPFCLVLPLQK